MNSTEEDSRRAGLISGPLLAWYADCARDLPWRREPEAYHVWVSEIMLQQTRVETVIPYYERFITALPSIGDLADCPESKLLKLWEGLGYYSRVRNMQRCARVLTESFDGQLPADEKQLLSLPGIGPYTAGAVASIAFGLPIPAVDGNVLRVISRIIGSRDDILLPATRSRIDLLLRDIIPADAPGAFNQALMDLGAMICLPSAAAVRCSSCPLQHICMSREYGLTQEIPVRIVKTRRKQEKRTILVIRDGSSVVIGKRPEKGLLAGLFELPGLAGHCSQKEVLQYVRSLGAEPLRILPLPEAKHVFTHLDWLMKGYEILTDDLEHILPGLKDLEDPVPGSLYALPAAEVGKTCAIPSAFRAYLPYIDSTSLLSAAHGALHTS